MNLLNFIKRILARFINIPRKIRQVYYICWNYFMLWANGVEIGKNMKIYNRIYLTKHPTAQVIIGNNLVFISGDGFNPLCRNLRGCIYAGEGAKIKIGNDVGISFACIRAKQYIKIGNNVNIGGDCILLDTDAHNMNYKIRRKRDGEDGRTANSAPIIIEDDVLIGARCIILKGVTIGAHSVIAAGSIVTKSIPKDCVAGGNPCKIIKNIRDIDIF